ncbi:MAG: FHA domain-containing protein [Phycisphaeraceae bacterium]|nr:FHA domain-containing protein [Phycisphaeraceae bacterium]
MLLLSVIQGPDKGRTFQLPADEPQLIGRSSEALPLSDNTVSRRHAELTPDRGEWFVRDLNSQNGTHVNGVAIRERTKLRPGDQVRCGSTLFVFGGGEPLDQREDLDLVRVLQPDQIDAEIERTLASNDDSVIMAEPEPRAAALHQLQLIYQLTALTTTLTDRDALLTAVLELVFNEFKPERGFIVLADTPADAPPATPLPAQFPLPEFRTAVVRHRTPPKDRKDARIHVSRTILQHAFRSGEGVLSSNAMSDPRFAKGDSVQQFKIRSALCSPIEFQNRRFGAIYIDSSIANYTFTQDQLSLLNAIARHTGLALANAEAYAKKLQTERLAAVGETVASLSHSIKNILQGLRGGADVVDMGLTKEDLKVARGGWTILKRNVDRIMGLTLNMLAYSRQRTIEAELTPITPLLEECAQLLSDQCAARQIAMILDADPEIPPIPLDAALMHQAVVNLLVNAVEAVEPAKGAVTIRASYLPATNPAERSAVRIDVIDNGPGIAPDRHARIFQPFQTTKGLRGTGLGLAVTKRIIEEHAGSIYLRSAEGRGATFTVLLPADAPDDGRTIDPSDTAGVQPLPPLEPGALNDH